MVTSLELMPLKKRMFVVCFALLFVILFSAPLAYGVSGYESVMSDVVQSGSVIQRQFSEDVFGVDVWVFLAGRYGFWDLNVRDEVVVNITIDLVEPPAEPYVVSAVIWFSLSGVENLPAGASYTYGFWGFPPVGILSVYLPANVSYASVRLRGYLTGMSVFWRNTAEVFFSNVTSGVIRVPSYRLVLVPPSPSRVLRVYSRRHPDLSYEDVSVGGQRRLIVPVAHPLSPVIVLYEPETWMTNAIILMFMVIFSVFAVPYVLKFKRSNSMLSQLNEVVQRFSPFKWVAGLIVVFKRLLGEILKLDSSKLLSAYILCALLMVSLSFGFGPEPRLKVYVLSSTPENAKIISDFIEGQGGVAITMFDEMSEFKLLSEFGVFSAVIVGDFFLPTEKMVREYIYPALDATRRIILLEPYAARTPVFVSEIEERYTDKVETAEDFADLGLLLRRIRRRTNFLGLNVSSDAFIVAAAFVGFLSFVIVFVGMAFLASKLIESGKKPGVSGLPEAIAYSVSIFMFTQIIYIICSVLLAMPLGLHTSSPKVTVVGFFGFGGGSIPRSFTGMFGFLFGSLVSLRGGVKLDRIGLISFLIAGFFVLIDPLTSGILFYELVLFFVPGPTLETALIAMSYIRGFLALVGGAFGAWVSPAYEISTGIIKYYSGAIAFSVFPKLKRITATILLLPSLFMVNSIFRVANMVPLQSVASTIPGIITGLFLAAIFTSLSFIETIIRKKAIRAK